MDHVRRILARNGLYRSSGSRVFGGVCAGLGERLGLGPWAARALFLLVLMLVPGSQLLVYPVLWFLLPVGGGDLAGRGPAAPPW